MVEDRYGLVLTTSSTEAGLQFMAAMDRALALRGGARPLLETAVEIDPKFALAWSMLGGQLRGTGEIAEGNTMIHRALMLADRATERERGHVEVLSLFAASRFADARVAAEQHLAAWPGDVYVLMYAHYLFNLYTPDLDRRARHLALAGHVAEHVPDDWYVLGELAFATEESGLYAEARELAERSLAMNPQNAAAAHSLAHALLETGAASIGATWLRRWLLEWQDPAAMGCHLTWHLALFQLFDGQPVTEELSQILGYVGRSVGVLSDGASLLWRLHLAGWTGLDWGVLSGVPAPAGNTFHGLHRALVLAGLRDVDGLAALSSDLRDRAMSGQPIASTCADVVDALSRFAQGDARGAAELLLSAEGSVAGLGGSRAQLEVVDDTLIAALRNSGQIAEARARLTIRLQRRPTRRDAQWLTDMATASEPTA